MSRCSVLFALLRWWHRDPTYGHEVIVARVGDGRELHCVRCGRAWRVQW